jgi:fatty acid desaturase
MTSSQIEPNEAPAGSQRPSRGQIPSHRTWEAPTLIVATVIYCGFAAVTWFFHDLPSLIAAPLASVLLAWHSSFQHEAIHGHPTPSRRVNTLLAYAPLSLWLPYEVYRETHLRHHRRRGRNLTRPADDPESHYLPTGALVGAGRARKAILRFNCTLVGRLTLGPALSVHRSWAIEIRRVRSREHGRIGVWMRHALSIAVVLAWVIGICRIPLPQYLLAIVYPSISLGLLRSFAEHRAHADPQLRTSVVETNRALSLLFLNNNLHIAHHARPSLAWYRLPRAWSEMRREAIEAGMIVRPGYRALIRGFLLRPIIDAEHPAFDISAR